VNQDPKQVNLAALMATVVGQVGCLVVIIIGLAMGAGVLLDKFLGTRAIFTVIFMVGSVPVALYLTVRMSLTAVARTQQAIDDKKAEEETDT
jgi:F0F1-type ATP synthase assembly protein I